MNGDETQESLESMSQSLREDVTRFSAEEPDEPVRRSTFGRFGRLLVWRREMGCEEFSRLVSRAVRGKLPWLRRRGFWEHSCSCDTCMRDYQRAESVWEEQQALAGRYPLDERPVARIASIVLTRAIEAGARAIKIEPSDKGLSVVMQTDTGSEQLMPLPRYISIALIARFKAMANMDLTKWDVPQEGILPITHGGKDYRLAIAIQP